MLCRPDRQRFLFKKFSSVHVQLRIDPSEQHLHSQHDQPEAAIHRLNRFPSTATELHHEGQCCGTLVL